MANATMGETISALRKAKGMTQKELADQMHVTDKAVSKWERNVACPDLQSLPHLAEVLGVSIEELMNAKPAAMGEHKGPAALKETILTAVPMAMGVAVTVTALMGKLDMKAGFIMPGVGLYCVALYLIKNKA